MKHTRMASDAEAKSYIADMLMAVCYFAVYKGELAGATEEEQDVLRSRLEGLVSPAWTAGEKSLHLTVSQVRRRLDRAVQLLRSSNRLFDEHMAVSRDFHFLVVKGCNMDKLRRLGADVPADSILDVFEEAFQLGMTDSESLDEGVPEWNPITHLAIEWSIRGKTAAAAALVSAAFALTGHGLYKWTLGDILDDSSEDYRLLMSHLDQLRKCADGEKAGSPDNAAINGNEP